MPKWCVESYPSSLYKFEKTRFWHFVIISGRGQGGPNPCLRSSDHDDQIITENHPGIIHQPAVVLPPCLVGLMAGLLLYSYCMDVTDCATGVHAHG